MAVLTFVIIAAIMVSFTEGRPGCKTFGKKFLYDGQLWDCKEYCDIGFPGCKDQCCVNKHSLPGTNSSIADSKSRNIDFEAIIGGTVGSAILLIVVGVLEYRYGIFKRLLKRLSAAGNAENQGEIQPGAGENMRMVESKIPQQVEDEETEKPEYCVPLAVGS